MKLFIYHHKDVSKFSDLRLVKRTQLDEAAIEIPFPRTLRGQI